MKYSSSEDESTPPLASTITAVALAVAVPEVAVAVPADFATDANTIPDEEVAVAVVVAVA